MEDIETLLEKLLKFYIKFKKLNTYPGLECPFNGSDLPCSKLCYRFTEISSIVGESIRCPCHAWGHSKAFEHLKELLINYNML